MIIRDLEHQEIISEIRNLEGGLSSLVFNLEFLSLGSIASVAHVTQAEFLSTSSPGINVASGKFSITMQAVNDIDVILGMV